MRVVQDQRKFASRSPPNKTSEQQSYKSSLHQLKQNMKIYKDEAHETPQSHKYNPNHSQTQASNYQVNATSNKSSTPKGNFYVPFQFARQNNEDAKPNQQLHHCDQAAVKKQSGPQAHLSSTDRQYQRNNISEFKHNFGVHSEQTSYYDHPHQQHREVRDMTDGSELMYHQATRQQPVSDRSEHDYHFTDGQEGNTPHEFESTQYSQQQQPYSASHQQQQQHHYNDQQQQQFQRVQQQKQAQQLFHEHPQKHQQDASHDQQDYEDQYGRSKDSQAVRKIYPHGRDQQESPQFTTSQGASHEIYFEGNSRQQNFQPEGESDPERSQNTLDFDDDEDDDFEPIKVKLDLSAFAKVAKRADEDIGNLPALKQRPPSFQPDLSQATANQGNPFHSKQPPTQGASNSSTETSVRRMDLNKSNKNPPLKETSLESQYKGAREHPAQQANNYMPQANTHKADSIRRNSDQDDEIHILKKVQEDIAHLSSRMNESLSPSYSTDKFNRSLNKRNTQSLNALILP